MSKEGERGTDYLLELRVGRQLVKSRERKNSTSLNPSQGQQADTGPGWLDKAEGLGPWCQPGMQDNTQRSSGLDFHGTAILSRPPLLFPSFLTEH